MAAVAAEAVLEEDTAVAASAEVAVAVPEVMALVAPAAVSREVRVRTRAPLWAGAGVPDTMAAVAAAWAASWA